ncbi:Hsp20/alpha crystallin family protein [Aeromicrobium sp. CTD01-1L150]|uniref:Hsp20/alpha crystallin family protein n=1 Tax=Aeromicrobium sp. CTD01-1L150 TaxID=3341830 RepID=UPI0035C0BB2D
MSTLTLRSRRDPFFSDFDALVRSAFGTGAGTGSGQNVAFSPAVETARDGDDIVVRLELPGVDVSEDVSVEVVSGRLVVKGERRDSRSEESESRRLSEIRYGSFQRTFSLPSHVTAEAVTASYDAGILSVRVAGVYAGTEPTRISIES